MQFVKFNSHIFTQLMQRVVSSLYLIICPVDRVSIIYNLFSKCTNLLREIVKHCDVYDKSDSDENVQKIVLSDLRSKLRYGIDVLFDSFIHLIKRLNSYTQFLYCFYSKVNLLRLSAVLCLIYLAPIANAKCTGKFVNPITDVCWDCIFPISIGNAKIFSSGNPDTKNPSMPICACGTPVPRIGLAAGFWEPVRLVDVTKTPFCFPNLGGMQINPGMKVGQGSVSSTSAHGNASWHLHWYVYPLLYWLELLLDFVCLENSSFDLAYMTELDPMWLDDSLTFIINPEAALFGNPIAQAACSADCAASSTGAPMDSLFWCAGCQGSMYPLTGNIREHQSSIQSGLLAAERFTFKLHREMIEWGTSGSKALCGKYPMPVMNKSQYRSQLTVPVPSKCSQFGKSTIFYDSGKEIPVIGENFGFLIWRKRNCCVL